MQGIITTSSTQVQFFFCIEENNYDYIFTHKYAASNSMSFENCKYCKQGGANVQYKTRALSVYTLILYEYI